MNSNEAFLKLKESPVELRKATRAILKPAENFIEDDGDTFEKCIFILLRKLRLKFFWLVFVYYVANKNSLKQICILFLYTIVLRINNSTSLVIKLYLFIGKITKFLMPKNYFFFNKKQLNLTFN